MTACSVWSCLRESALLREAAVLIYGTVGTAVIRISLRESALLGIALLREALLGIALLREALLGIALLWEALLRIYR